PVPRLVDMQQEYLTKPRPAALAEAAEAPANRRRPLGRGRRRGMPVAFARIFGGPAFFHYAPPDMCRIAGFQPHCSRPFGVFRNLIRRDIVMAGVAGESSCRSAVVDTFRRRHKLTGLSDASASHALDDLSARDMRRAVPMRSSLHSGGCEASEWITATTL